MNFLKHNLGLMASVLLFSTLITISYEVKSDDDDECSLYQLDLDNVSTYTANCGRVNSGKWRVSNETCTLTTSSITLPGSSGASPNIDIPINFEIGASGNNDASDYARFEYSVNGGAWTLLSGTSINPLPGNTITHTTYSYKIVNVGQAATLQVRAIFSNNDNDEKIDLYNEEGLCVSTALETGTTTEFKGTTLPISLTSFTASAADKKINLEWVTATETNNDYFTIERSENGANFTKITTLRGAGNSSSSRYYSTFDENPVFGNAYYRLKQTDFDGKCTFSDVISVAVNVSSSSKKCKFNIVPNPCSGQCNVYVTECDKTDISVTLIDAMGNEVYSKIPVSNQSNYFSLDARNNLKPGVYIVMGHGNDQKFNEKIVVQ